eukprot:652480-Hanusia_phi.AAC.1
MLRQMKAQHGEKVAGLEKELEELRAEKSGRDDGGIELGRGVDSGTDGEAGSDSRVSAGDPEK